MTWKHSELARSLDVFDVRGKFVIIRVDDPRAYAANGDLIGRELKKRGAALVICARPEDKIELLSEYELHRLGLQKIPKDQQ